MDESIFLLTAERNNGRTVPRARELNCLGKIRVIPKELYYFILKADPIPTDLHLRVYRK